MIPGPSEPSKALVVNLLLLWQGVPLQCGQSDIQTVHCGPLCVACDLPARRKTRGFLIYAANLGCS